MRLISVKINSELFKEEIELKVDSGKVCLIGMNGSGKSTVLKALSDRSDKEFVYKTTLTESKEYFDYQGPIEVHIEKKDSKIAKVKIMNESEILSNLKKKLIMHGNDVKSQFDLFFDKIKDVKGGKYAIRKKEYTEKRLLENKGQLELLVPFTKFDMFTISNLEEDFYTESYLEEEYLSFVREILIDDGIVVNLTKEFFEKYKNDFLQLIKKMENYNEVVRHVNKGFSKYSIDDNFYSYVSKNIHDFTMLSSVDLSRSEESVSRMLIRPYKNKVYKHLLTDIEHKIINRSFSDDEFTWFSQHGIINSDHDDDNFLQNAKAAVYESDGYFLSEIQGRIERADLYDDIVENFNGGCLILPLSGLDEIISEINENLNNLPEFESENIEYVTIGRYTDEEDSVESLGLFFKDFVVDDLLTMDDIASGRAWYYTFRVAKDSLTENTVLLIDEPAVHLHLTAQKEVLDEIMSMENSVIYATHEPTLIALSKKDFSVYKMENDGAITSKLIEQDNYNEIVSSIGLSESQQMMIRSFNSPVIITSKSINLHSGGSNFLRKDFKMDVPFIKVQTNRAKDIVKFLLQVSDNGLLIIDSSTYKTVRDLLGEFGEFGVVITGDIYGIPEDEFIQLENLSKYKRLSELIEEVQSGK